MEPASIRYKNPGAMWGSALAIKWGANSHPVTLNDGKGQGNNIAVFPTYVQGICAQMDLWRTSIRYKDHRFADAIAVWSGHNSVESYIAFVLKRVSGMTRDTVLNDAFWRGPMAIPFLKAQAWHEAGKEYPAPEEDWVEAHGLVLGGTQSLAAIPASPILTPGRSGAEVLKLQGLLGVVGTGEYHANSETQFALQLFQVRNGLAPDGKCGPLTWAKLEGK